MPYREFAFVSPNVILQENLYEALINMLRIPDFLLAETGFYKHAFPKVEERTTHEVRSTRDRLRRSPHGANSLLQ